MGSNTMKRKKKSYEEAIDELFDELIELYEKS